VATATIIIKDAGESIEIEGHLDPANALDLPPTPAVIVGSFLAGNMDRVAKDAMQWFQAMTIATQSMPADEPSRLIVPDQTIRGPKS
jgi:hypothetical protein